MALKKLNWAKDDIVEQTPERILLEKTIASLSEDERMDFEERVAIMEYDGVFRRKEAERRALEILQKHEPGE